MKGRLFLTLALTLLLAAGCCTVQKDEPPDGEDFAVYLLAKDIPKSEMPLLNYVELADEPCISLEDIILYKWTTHEIELTATAVQRLSGLDVPMSGKVFVVCVNREPIYWGAFWSSLSSELYLGVTAYVHPFILWNTIQFRFSESNMQGFDGKDLKSDARIMQPLERADKLR